MSESHTPNLKEAHSTFKAWKVILPVIIGLAVVALMFWHDARKENLSAVWGDISWTPRAIGCVLLAWGFMLGRDVGLTWRFRALTDNTLSWRRAFRVDWLCEFTSCVTPSAVGGSSLGMVFLNTQGVEFGRATTLMITTIFLDELFLVVSCPIVVLFTPAREIFASGASDFSQGIQLTFWIVYAGIAAWTGLLFVGIILKPHGLRKALHAICSLPFLRRWQSKVDAMGDNMVATSVELRTKPFGFWLEAFGATTLSWLSRFMVVNALFLAFLPQDDPWQWVILARQFVVWVILMVSPTPGGSGLSEWLFTEYYGDLVPTAAMALILAIFWRVVSYYIYLAIGAYVVPRWLQQTLGAHRRK